MSIKWPVHSQRVCTVLCPHHIVQKTLYVTLRLFLSMIFFHNGAKAILKEMVKGLSSDEQVVPLTTDRFRRQWDNALEALNLSHMGPPHGIRYAGGARAPPARGRRRRRRSPRGGARRRRQPAVSPVDCGAPSRPAPARPSTSASTASVRACTAARERCGKDSFCNTCR